MKKQPPEKVSQQEVVFKVEELEPLLSPPPMSLKPWKPMYIELRGGKKMVIRQMTKEEAPELLPFIKKFLNVDHDFYDIVGARVYAEILGWYRNRLKDPYLLVGVIDGELAALGNGRLMNDDINISLHTMAFKRGLRAGAAMYYAKTYYTFEILKQKEFWATYESYNGFKRWGIGMAQPSYPWPEYQHELGGAKVFYITKNYWDASIKKYLEDYLGTTLKAPVSDDLLKQAASFKIPENPEV